MFSFLIFIQICISYLQLQAEFLSLRNKNFILEVNKTQYFTVMQHDLCGMEYKKTSRLQW